MERPLSIATAVLSGFFVAAIMRINASLGEAIGLLEATFVVHLVGSIFALFLMARRLNRPLLRSVVATPLPLFAGGAIGVCIVWVGNWVIPKLGMAFSTGIVVVTTLFFSALADHYQWLGMPRFPMTRRRWVGLACAVAGTWLIYGRIA
ncbi:MAG: DMT family transporter [Deltaproteobacteria bacterium]|nr:DMT family transporter [Deltaproteobacteria bacterium]